MQTWTALFRRNGFCRRRFNSALVAAVLTLLPRPRTSMWSLRNSPARATLMMAVLDIKRTSSASPLATFRNNDRAEAHNGLGASTADQLERVWRLRSEYIGSIVYDVGFFSAIW